MATTKIKEQKHMSKYQVVYKCQLCGTLSVYGDAQEVPANMVSELINKVVQQNQLFAGNPYLHKAPMYMTHKCQDGSIGLANFAGFRIVE